MNEKIEHSIDFVWMLFMVSPRPVFTQHVSRRWSWLVARLWAT